MTSPAQHRVWIFSLPAARAALAIAFMLTVVASQPAQAQTYTVLHNFTGGQDGANPESGVTMDKAGNLYGTTFRGGTSGNGAVYQLKLKNSNFVFNPLYSFAGGSDGANPEARVIFGPDGSLYGTTSNGGGNCAPSGCGTVFKLRPPPTACKSALCAWTETLVHSFEGIGGGDGDQPGYGDVIFDQAGNVYGTTIYGGGGLGCVYELTPSGGGWTESFVYLFVLVDGYHPYNGVSFDSFGNLYGTTYDGYQGGGQFDLGTVFQLAYSATTGWTEKLLWIFPSSGNSGGNPVAGVIFDQSGNLYGATTYGNVFELTPSGQLTDLYILTGQVWGNLVMDKAGSLYGTTLDGGRGFGNVFKLTPSDSGWTYRSLHDFCMAGPPCHDGESPYGNVIIDANGNLYGTASAGGSGGRGVVWEITP